MPLNQALQKRREKFVEKLLENDLSSFFVITHPKYAKSKNFRFTPAPVPLSMTHKWEYKKAKKMLLELGEILTPEEAERRNVNFINPGLKDVVPGAILPTLRGGIQLLKPDEREYTHRHTVNAFRFVLEAPSQGAYTVVEGHKVPMHPGDLILTPSWVWHDHGNEGNKNAIWFDGLDATIAFWIGAGFYQDFEEAGIGKAQAATSEAEDVLARYAMGLKPLSESPPPHLPATNNPLLYYPYDEVRNSLFRMAAKSDGSPHEGIVIEYVNPTTGGPAFPTMMLRMHLVKPGKELEPVCRTENAVFITFEGNGTFNVGDKRFDTEPFDVLSVPTWQTYRISNNGTKPLILFSYSDQPIFRTLGFYREMEKMAIPSKAVVRRSKQRSKVSY